MPTTRIKEKISKLVGNQLPEFIQTDYTTFVKFIEYYYEFLEQDQGAYEIIQNARSYADIDRTTAAFVKYFITNYGNNLPATIQGDKTILVKNLKDLYESKGSELSFKLLFSLLYNTTVDVTYPYENVLRASDGTWQQLVSIRVETVSGDRTKIDSHILSAVKNGITYSAPVIKVLNLTSTLTEIFLSPTSSIVIENVLAENNEVFTKEDATEVFRGKVKLTTTGYSVIVKGRNFKKGQIFKVNDKGAVNTLFKISNVTTTGGINDIKFINYGYGFTSNVTLNFKADSTVGSSFEGFVTTTGGFSETGTIFSGTDYFSEAYLDNNLYVMTPVQTFSNTFTANAQTTTGTLEDEDFATIIFTLGVLGRYPGSWTTNRGFISDNEIRLQDDQLYQPFAYLLNTDTDISLFYDVVKELVHPAGQSLFNNRVLDNTIDIRTGVEVVSFSNLTSQLFDTAITSDSLSFEIDKLLSDTYSTLDSANLSITLGINNTISNVSVTDSISGFSYQHDYTEGTYFAEIYVANPPEGSVVI